MSISKKNTTRLIVFSVVGILILFNPNLPAFEAFANKEYRPNLVFQRTSYFLIFSIFKKQWDIPRDVVPQKIEQPIITVEITYIGVAGFFLNLNCREFKNKSKKK